MAVFIVVGGCGDGGDAAGSTAPDAGAAQATSAAEVIATVDGEPIRRVELEARLRLRLYELERRAHRLRREQLDELIATRIAPGATPDVAAERLREAHREGRVQIHLDPPERPRLSVPAGEAPGRGGDHDSLSLVVFCDFASSHCARFQPVLRQLLEVFPDDLRVVHRDHPLPFHRHATEAAVAARCAGEQDAYFRYHDALFTRDRLDAEVLNELAQAIGLDPERFRACTEEGDNEAHRAVARDSAIAARLGLPRVPTSFLNGLYIPGAPSFEAVSKLVRAELGTESPQTGARPSPEPSELPTTALPLRLVATLAHDDPERASAVIESERFEGALVFVPGDRVLDDARLERVEPRRVVLRRADDRLEQLPLRGSAIAAEPPPPPPPHLDAEGVLHLPRARVDRALEDREALERVLEPGRLDLEGQRLLKLEEVEPGSLYDLLGLQAKDVLMQVDGVFVHDAYNPLFEALRTQQRVTVTVMRGGFPKTLEIAID